MKRIMFMTNTLYGGGAEKVLQTILKNLDYGKYDVTLYSMHREVPDPEKYPNSVKYRAVFDSYSGSSRLLGFLHALYAKVRGKAFQILPSSIFYRLFIRGTYDVEVAFIEGESTKIIAGSPNKKSRKIAWVHVDLEANPWTDFLYDSVESEAKEYSKFNQIVCVSNATREAFLKKYNIVQEDIVVVHYNPIDQAEIIANSLLGEEIIKEDSRIIVAVGRLVHQKGFDRLLRACGRLKDDGFCFSLHIIGQGEEKNELVKLSLQENIENNVVFHDYLDNPYPIMKSSDLLVCSSRAEGYSLVVAEAMILGLAIVSTECSGPVELLEHGQYGLLAKNSTDGIYSALKTLLNDAPLIDYYKKKSIERAEIFNLSNNMLIIEQILDGKYNEPILC